jgi:hypothetical protein
MSAFCLEWKRLQSDDPFCAGLPDPTAFWFDTEEENEVSNILRRSSLMQEDSRWDERGWMPGINYSVADIYQIIRDRLAPEDRLPEVGDQHLVDGPMGTLVDTTSLGPSEWSSSRYAAWSQEMGPWVHRIQAAAMYEVADKEIKEFFPSAMIGNWNTSSAHTELEVNDLTWERQSGHGTHASHVNYSTPRSRTEAYCISDTYKPQAPWIYYPFHWGSWGDGNKAQVNNWRLDGSGTQLPSDLQTKYADEIAAVSGDTNAENLLLAEIYWREGISIFRDAGVRHYLCWWDPLDIGGVEFADVGPLVETLYDGLFSTLPSTPLAKYLNPDVAVLASGVPHWKLRNGIQSWTLKMVDNGTCILKINHGTYIGSYTYVEHALQVIVALHLRLGARAYDENTQRALKALIDSKYITEA